jgi:hypothetical protein
VDITLVQYRAAAAAVCPHAAQNFTQNAGFINDENTCIPLSCTRIIIIIIRPYFCAILCNEPRSKELS